MKIFLLVLTCTTVFGQAPTTQEEYNYITKGYKIMLESGLDVKKGYLIIDVKDYTTSSYTFSFKYLVREQPNEVAAILVIAKSILWGNTYYVCIPNSTENMLYPQYTSVISAWDKSMLLEYHKAYEAIAHAKLIKQ